jgi:hypothetical protein
VLQLMGQAVQVLLNWTKSMRFETNQQYLEVNFGRPAVEDLQIRWQGLSGPAPPSQANLGRH